MTTKETKIRLPLELHGWLMSQAESQDISLTKYIIQVLEDHKNIPNNIPNNIPTDFERRLLTLENSLSGVTSRLSHLEGADSGSDTWKPEFTIGQRVTKQYSRLFGLLSLAPAIEQKSKDNKTTFYCYPDLGVVVKMLREKGKVIFQVLGVFNPEQHQVRTWVDDAGNTLFMDSEDSWNLEPQTSGDSCGDIVGDSLETEVPMTEEQPNPEPHTTHLEVIAPTEEVNIAQSVELEPITDASSLIADDSKEPESSDDITLTEPEPSSTGDTDIPNSGDTELTLTTEELLDRFKSKVGQRGAFYSVKRSLSEVNLKKTLIAKHWTAQYDPDGLTWIPTDDMVREYWVVYKLSPEISPTLSPESTSVS